MPPSYYPKIEAWLEKTNHGGMGKEEIVYLQIDPHCVAQTALTICNLS